ncbi:MAG TPA: beta-galactosidase trimerization domain-containing protein [Terriglobia bacterium]|nr:beta-galactosidase trimerization domain-containing protein [Terriglobia bacterium]
MKRRTFLQISPVTLGARFKFLADALRPRAFPESCGCAPGNAKKVRNDLEVEHALSLDFLTPHTEWAKPYARGTVSALFFTLWYSNSTYAREIIELLERFDLKAQAVYFERGAGLVGDGNPNWYGGDPEAGTKRALRLLDEPHDVLFFNELKLDALARDVRDRIHQKVAEGTGLVMAGASDGPPFEDARAITPPADQPARGGYYAVGKGRCILLPSRAKLQFELGWETEFDYQMQIQGRALLWAARREPAAGLKVDIHPQIARRSSLPAKAVRLAWSGMPAGTEVQAVLRRSDGNTRDLQTVKASGEGSVEIMLPLVREGKYHIDAFARNSRLTENWATAEFRVEASRRVESVVLKKDWAEIGETVTCQVHLNGKPPSQDRLQASLVDRRGRILAQQVAAWDVRGSASRAQATDAHSSPVPFAVTFTFKIEPWMPMLLRVEAVLLDEQSEVSAAYAYLRVTKRHRNQFNFVMWGVPSSDLGPYGVENLARHGVTAILQGGPPPLALAQYDLSYVPYVTSFRGNGDTVTSMLDPKTGFLKTGCVHDRQAMQESIRKVVGNLHQARELGVFAYDLGDENAVRASCLSPDCLRAYRQYLKRIYGNIASLNREWNSHYAAFEDIQLLSDGTLPSPDAPTWFKEYFSEWLQLHRTDSESPQAAAHARQIKFGEINDELRALQASNYARWYDRQAFQDETYVAWCKQFQKAFKELDPQAWTGFEGTDNFGTMRMVTRTRFGGDLDLMIREMDYFDPYPGPGNQVIRSVAPRRLARGNWMGYVHDAEGLLGRYWSQVTDGMNTVQWWRWDNVGQWHGYLTPSLVPFPAVQELVKDTQVVRDGLGNLLMECPIHEDGVVIMYSMPSTQIAHFDGNRTYGDYKRDHAVWQKLLHNAGVEFGYVTDRMLRLGEFDAARYRVMLLPLTYAMGPQEAEVIRDFVRNGGTVVADVRPSLYDGHCKPLEKGQLDDVFGIRRDGKRDALEIDRMRVEGELNHHPLQMEWGDWHGHHPLPPMKIDPTVELTTGKASGQAFWLHYWAGLKTPVCIVNNFGKGRAVLLNFSVFQAPVAGLLKGLLASAGVEPALRITCPDGRPPKGVEITRWTNGSIELLSLLGDYEGDVKVHLPQARFVSDLKNQTAVRQTSEFTTTLAPGRAAFFALMPAQAPTPQLTLPEASIRRGSAVKALVAVPRAAGKHPVMIRAVDPSGKDADWLAQTVIAGEEPVPVTLAFAHNDPPGVWQLRATDLLGKETSTVKLRLL